MSLVAVDGVTGLASEQLGLIIGLCVGIPILIIMYDRPPVLLL